MSSVKLCGGAKSLKLSHQLCNGELSLTEEEKRTLVSEGISYSIFGILVFLAIPTLFLVSKVLSIRIFCFLSPRGPLVLPSVGPVPSVPSARKICLMNHEKTHQTNPMAPWDPLDALLAPWGPLGPPAPPLN